jgi:surface polysaccharide O-acyltransferase-like enzyme
LSTSPLPASIQLLIPLLAIKKTEHQQVITNAAVIRSAIEEVQRFLYDSTSTKSYVPCKCVAYRDKKYHSIAAEIVDRRTSGTDQAWLAIALYILGIIANFVSKLGGNPSPSGGKIAPPMFLSWLLPTMLLSNIVGQFN